MFLPSGLLDYFDLINSESLETCFILFLEEKNIIPEECKTLPLHSKGFMPEIEVQDFPIRGKAVYLRIKRPVGKILKPVKHIVVIGIWLPPALA
ncbi:hypothetical protein [uncultured Bacteroides sp.]|uniref:ISAon1 family transposase N-terminal region protein n=1 Tax=uncultured Bacteroides sp. TaxID=162156 RepID=UPI003749B339